MNEQIRKEFIIKHGFKNIAEFARSVNDNQSNILKILKGQRLPEIQKLFMWADILQVNITELLYLFYTDAMEKNQIYNKKA